MGDGRSLTYEYFVGGDDDGRLKKITEKIGETAVGVTEYGYTFWVSGRLLTEVETRCLDIACNTSLVTTTTYLDEDKERIDKIEFPDGRVDQYDYQKAIVADPGLPNYTFGTSAYSYTAIEHFADTGLPLSGKTTRDTTILNPDGNVWLTETFGYDGTYDRMTWGRSDYDDRGRVTETNRSDQTVVETTYVSCCGVDSVKDASGILTQFGDPGDPGDPDVLGRILSTTAFW